MCWKNSLIIETEENNLPIFRMNTITIILKKTKSIILETNNIFKKKKKKLSQVTYIHSTLNIFTLKIFLKSVNKSSIFLTF